MADKKLQIQIAATGGAQAAAEVRKVDAATESLGTTNGKASGKMEEFARAGAKVSASSINLRSTVSNVGYQIQDFAVQVGMGTSAVRAFGQQAPQLLSAFGPWGIGLGTVIALGAPLAGMLMGQAEAADDVSDAYEDAVAKTIELAKAEADAIKHGEQRAESLRQLSQAVEEATSRQNGYNDAAKQGLEILQEQAAREEAIAAAKGQTEIEEADGDPVKQEQIKNRLRKEAQEREQANLQKQADARSALIEGLFAEQQRIDADSANVAGAFRSQAEGVGEQALQKEQEATLAEGRGEKSKAEDLKREADALRKQQDDLVKSAEEAEKAATSAIDSLNKEMQSIYQEMRKLRNTIDTNKEIFAERDKAGDIRESRVSTREAERRQATADAEARKRAADEDRRNREAASAGRAAEGLLPKGVGDEFRRKVEGISDGLQNGDQGGEMAKLLSAMETLAAAVEKRGDKSLARRIDILEQRIRNIP